MGSSDSVDRSAIAFQRVIEAFSMRDGVTTSSMFGSPGLKLNGKFFAMRVGGDFVAKLPASRVDALVRGGRGERFDPGHGRVMREWVRVPVEGTPSWTELAGEALEFQTVRDDRAGRRPRRSRRAGSR